MCTYSMVVDHYKDVWQDKPWFIDQTPPVSREEFETLRRQVEEMSSLLKRAKEYDEKTGQPDCEMDEKVALIRKVADLVGVDLESLQ